MCNRLMALVCLATLGLGSLQLAAQDARPGDEAPPASRPQDAQPLTATAVVVQRTVLQSPVGTKPTQADAWTPVAVGDELSSGTQVRVGIRSTLVLRFGDDTVIQLKSITLASLDELYRTETSKVSRIGLAYGAIRGSVREETLRSDMVITSPVMSCSKEGTRDFEVRAMRGSRAWWADGPTDGAILIRDLGTGQTERLSFGQLVDYFTMASPAVQRNLTEQVVDMYGSRFMSTGERDFHVYVDSGQSVTGPGLGAQAVDLIPGTGAPPPDFLTRFPNLRDDTLRLLLEQNAALLFRHVESRFGTGPFPKVSQGIQRRR